MSTAAPIEPQIVTEFRREPRSYIIHNSSPEWRERMYAGTFVRFPPINVIGPDPGRDKDGDPIPGTTLVKDLFGSGGPDAEIFGDGSTRLTFDAADATKFILGIDERTARANSRAALGGLSLIPKNSTKEYIARIVEGGKARHQVVSADNDRETIAAFTAKAAVHQREGLPMPAPPPNYHEAVARENVRAEAARKAFEASLPANAVELEEDELEFIAFAKAKAAELAEGAGKNLSASARAQLAEQFLEDPAVRMKLQKNFKIRKRGHLGDTTETLKKLAQETGETLESEE